MAGDRADEFHRSVCCMSHDLHSHCDGRCVCWTCSELYRRDLSNLAACLREAAGLEHALFLGLNANNQTAFDLHWTPGRRRPAPGWTVK